MHNIVFLDRDSLLAQLRRPAFEHSWQEHAATSEAEVVARLRGASIAITDGELGGACFTFEFARPPKA